MLKNNVFKFNEHIFTQLHGIAMGTKLAPALASIYIGDLEESFLSSCKLQPTLWVRYIDDVFMVWPHALEEFDKFLKDLNSVRERIRFTAEVNTQSCNFLDLTIYKGPEFLSTGRLSTKIYYKPTNTFSFPLGSSHMPTQFHRSIAIWEMTHLLRNTDNPALYRHYQNKLIKKFKRRGYPKKILREIKDMTHNKRPQVLHRLKRKTRMERPLPFVTTFENYDPPLNRIFHARWKKIYEEHRFYSLLPNAPFTVYRNKRTLGSLMSSKRSKFNTRYIPNLTLDTSREFKFMRFNHHRHPIR